MESKHVTAITVILSALGGLLTVLGMHGSKAIEALAGVPALLRALASGLPLGLWSSALALVLAVLVWLSAMRWMPMAANGKAPLAAAGVLSVVTGLVVTISQYHAVAEPTAGGLLNAIYLGFGAGLAGPFVGAFLRRQGRTEKAP